MLVLSRKVGQELVIGDNIRITINRVGGSRVTLGIAAPDDVRIVRGELEPVVRSFDAASDKVSVAGLGSPATLPDGSAASAQPIGIQPTIVGLVAENSDAAKAAGPIARRLARARVGARTHVDSKETPAVAPTRRPAKIRTVSTQASKPSRPEPVTPGNPGNAWLAETAVPLTDLSRQLQ